MKNKGIDDELDSLNIFFIVKFLVNGVELK
jgi:hypothetical protein